jgi:hypothetical protein
MSIAERVHSAGCTWRGENQGNGFGLFLALKELKA